MDKKLAFFFIICVAVIVLLVFCIFVWLLSRQQTSARELADFNPLQQYNLEQLTQMYPQSVSEDVPTIQSPEQTHAKLLQALQKEDFDEAVACCFVKSRHELMKERFIKTRDKGLLDQMIKDLGVIKPDFIGDTKASFFFNLEENEEMYKEFITFVKNKEGIWLIESI